MDTETKNAYGLQQLIQPVEIDTFVREYKEKKALYIPGDQNRFGELFGWDDINHHLNFGRPSLEGVRLVYEKQSLANTELARVSEWLIKGATLVINSVDQIDPIVAHFASVLSGDLNRHININSYASCPAKQGFDTHYDRHDVFIVATEGEKSWHVFDPTYFYPLERQTFNKGDAPDASPYLECVMTPGDVLYIPRGHWHYAIAVTPSVHLTVGPYSSSGIDFLVWFADALMGREEFLRQDFPVTGIELLGGERGNEEFEQHLEQFQKKILEVFGDRDLLREQIMQYCLTTIKDRRNYRLPEMALLGEKLTPDTEFQMNPGQKFVARYDPDTNNAVITIKGHILDLKQVPVKVVESLLNSEGIVSGQKLLSADDSVKWDDVKAFITLLFERGVISPVADSGS